MATCELCDLAAEYCDSVPDASVPGYSHSEAGHRRQYLCWLHAVDRRQVATSRVEPLFPGTDHVDGGVASGDCVCDACGLTYWRHTAVQGTYVLLCSETVVKL